MLFTDAKWAESNAFRRAIAKPFQPWRCVGWTHEEVCFWIFPRPESNLAGELPDGLLVVGADVLLDVTGQMKPDTFSVYVMQGGVQGRPATLQLVMELWSQARTDGVMADYWCRTDEGSLIPCSHLQQRAPSDAPLELAFATQSHNCSGCNPVAA